MASQFIRTLEEKLNANLPGRDAHLKMMPKGAEKSRLDEEKMAKARESSVLILLYKKNDIWHIPLTQRHDYGGTHSGQVSLPGGKREPQDKDFVATALRETHEEIGVQTAENKVIGKLTDIFIPPSNFRVSPVVAYSEEELDFDPDDYEVKELLEVSLEDIIYDARISTTKMTFNSGLRVNVPYFDLNDKIVWGATAMILSELRDVVGGVTI